MSSSRTSFLLRAMLLNDLVLLSQRAGQTGENEWSRAAGKNHERASPDFTVSAFWTIIRIDKIAQQRASFFPSGVLMMTLCKDRFYSALG